MKDSESMVWVMVVGHLCVFGAGDSVEEAYMLRYWLSVTHKGTESSER